MKLADLMNKEPAIVYGGESVQKAAEEMARTNHGFLVVMNNTHEKKVIGVLSNKDVINRVIAKGISPTNRLVSDVMTKDLVKIIPEASSSDAMILMRKHKVKRVLVMERDMLLGIVTANDLIDGMIRYKKELLDMAIEF